jgi:cytochrome c556
VQDERLRAVMGEISEHTKRWPAGVPDDPEVKQSRESEEAAETFRDAAALADGLADAAERIPQAVHARPMDPGDRRGFTTEANRLRRQAVELKAAAEGRRVERMQRALDAISSTCVGCHGKYRDIAGELGPRKASAE